MVDDTEQQLLQALTRPVELGERWTLRLDAVEALVASAVGGERQGKTMGMQPDIVVNRAGKTPVVLEIKGTRQPDAAQAVRALSSSLLATSVELRRSFREDVALAAVIVPIASESDPQSGSGATFINAVRLARNVQRLLRGQDGVGFDSVLVADVSDGLKWHRFTGPASAVAPASKVEPTREMVSGLLAESSEGPASQQASPSGNPLRILLVCDEWRSGRGGISTVNRELAIALATAGAEVAVMVPSASDEDLQAASDRGVDLVQPAAVPGLADRELLLLRPIFADKAWIPDVVVGHGRLLGPYAYALQQEYFPKARRVQVVHTDAEQLEAAKETLGGESHMMTADDRRALERRLAQSADLVVGVGPLLKESIEDELLGTGATPPVTCLLPGLGPEHVVDPARIPAANTVLFVGRADDFRSKGIDILAEAMLEIVSRWPAGNVNKPILALRGVPEDRAADVKRQLEEIIGDQAKWYLRPYTESVEDLVVDMAKAKVVVMPSRHEGFGLAALEAIAMGVPVLVSQQSGLARFMSDQGLDTYPSSIVTTDNTATHLAVDRWSDALEQVLLNPVAARENAAKLRSGIDAVVTWTGSGAGLLATLETL